MPEPEQEKSVEGFDLNEVMRRAGIRKPFNPHYVLAEAWIRHTRRIPFPEWRGDPSDDAALTGHLDERLMLARTGVLTVHSMRRGDLEGRRLFEREDLVPPGVWYPEFDQRSNEPLDLDDRNRFNTQAGLRAGSADNAIKQALRDMGLPLPSRIDDRQL